MIIYLLGVFTLMILDCISYARIRKADSIADSENPSQFRIVSFSKKKFHFKTGNRIDTPEVPFTTTMIELVFRYHKCNHGECRWRKEKYSDGRRCEGRKDKEVHLWISEVYVSLIESDFWNVLRIQIKISHPEMICGIKFWNFNKNEQRRNGYAPVKHYRSFQEIRILDEPNHSKSPISIKRAQTI